MKMSGILLVCALLLPQASVRAADQPSDPHALIQASDRMRLPQYPSARLSMRLTTTGQGAERAYGYDVASRDDGDRTLVRALDGDQKGQKYLSTPDGYWLYAPRTRRALRLTALQILRGQASIGDVSRLRFAEDYTATFQKSGDQTWDGQPCWVIALRSKSPRSTYASAVMWIRKSNGAPTHADLLALSGRKLKGVDFATPITQGGTLLVRTATYIDGVNPAKRTKVEILSVKPADNPLALYRPEGLADN